MAGVLLTNVHAPSEIFYAVFNPELGKWTGLIPQAGDRFRAYFVYPKTMGYRLQGKSKPNLFIHGIPYHRRNDSHRRRVDYQVGSYGSGENLLFYWWGVCLNSGAISYAFSNSARDSASFPV